MASEQHHAEEELYLVLLTDLLTYPCSPFFVTNRNNSYILLLGLMKFENPKTIWSDIKTSTIPLILSGLKLWPLAHCVTYGLIPVENRLLWVDFVEIFWVTILASQAAGLSSGHKNEASAVTPDAIQETRALEVTADELALVSTSQK